VVEAIQEISPNALTSESRATGYLKRAKGLEEQAIPFIPLFINSVTGRFQAYTGRRVLKVRTFRNPASISCTATDATKTLTGTGFNALKIHDDAAGAGVQLGSRIEKIASDSSLDLDKAVTAALAGTSVVFGSEVMTVSGDGTDTLRIPESPLHAVYSAKSLDGDGAETTLDLTAARIVRQTTPGEAKLMLMSGDVFPKGWQNIRVECMVGIRPPSAARGEQGDWDEWDALELLCLRGVQVSFQDFLDAVGRTGTFEMASATQHIASFKLPDDLREGLLAYRRVG